MRMNRLHNFVEESNRIEGIHEARDGEYEAHLQFLALPSVCISDLEAFVTAVAGTDLRSRRGMDVRVGSHVPPRGGSEIVRQLSALLADLQCGPAAAWTTHKAYETLHPFTDGNGRSGRVLWLWQMTREVSVESVLRIGFLHRFYYQTLEFSR